MRQVNAHWGRRETGHDQQLRQCSSCNASRRRRTVDPAVEMAVRPGTRDNVNARAEMIPAQLGCPISCSRSDTLGGLGASDDWLPDAPPLRLAACRAVSRPVECHCKSTGVVSTGYRCCSNYTPGGAWTWPGPHSAARCNPELHYLFSPSSTSLSPVSGQQVEGSCCSTSHPIRCQSIDVAPGQTTLSVAARRRVQGLVYLRDGISKFRPPRGERAPQETSRGKGPQQASNLQASLRAAWTSPAGRASPPQPA